MNNELIKILNDFCVNEYGEELGQDNLEDFTRIPIMFTSYEKGEVDEIDEELSVQVFANIISHVLFVEYNGIKVYEEKYDKVTDFIDMLECLDYDSWVNTDEIDEYIKLKGLYFTIDDVKVAVVDVSAIDDMIGNRYEYKDGCYHFIAQSEKGFICCDADSSEIFVEDFKELASALIWLKGNGIKEGE